MTLKVGGIDPGKKGYECVLGCEMSDGSKHNPPQPMGPMFWPALVMKDPGDEGPPVYNIQTMVTFCRQWRESNVCLVVLELQGPQRRGSGKFGQGKEGSWASWSNGFGFGAWQTALVAAGFVLAEEADLRPGGKDHKAVTGMSYEVSCPFYVIADPLVWKRRMAAVASHRGEDTRQARRRANDLKTIEVAHRIDPTLDLRAVERGGTKRSDSPDQAASFLLAVYGERWILNPVQET